MLDWTLSFLIIAIIAGLLGFTGVAIISIDIARITFVIFLALWLLALLVGFLRKGEKTIEKNLK